MRLRPPSRSRRPRSRKGLISATAIGLVAGSLALVAGTAPAQAAATHVVISEVYGGGGNSGAVYKNDYIELFNPTGAPVDLTGWSLQYRSAANTAQATVANTTNLSGSIAAGGYFLVQQAAGTGGTDDLPTPDATGTIALGAGGGQVWLSNGTTRLDPPDGNVAAATPGIVDFVGATQDATSFEGAPMSGVPDANRSAARLPVTEDTGDNSVDFELDGLTPRNSSFTSAPVCDTIAEVQGSGNITPCYGESVTVTGVVTGKYPTGGFDGFYLQTGGTGSGTDLTPGQSDGLFVFTPTFDDATLTLGDGVTVTGEAGEFFANTQINAASVTAAAGQAPVIARSAAYPTTGEDREAHEGELMAPTGNFTVTNSFNTNRFGEVGLATGTTPLIQPTDVEDFQTGDVAGITADNLARGVVLDDGASVDYLIADTGVALPWLSKATPVRVGAKATLTSVASASTTDGVILDYRNNSWKFQPQQRVIGTGAATNAVATFANTRSANLTPRNVGGDVTLATFNVLNYFNTTGQAWVAAGLGTCSYFNDRAGTPIANNQCNPDGPRGAATDVSLSRQQAKIVTAINTLDADIVGLEEIENSAKLGEPRDDALTALVTALNTAAGFQRWAFAPSPSAANLPTVAEQDVIRNAFIYDPSVVERVGASRVLVGNADFANAREPLAQAFKEVGATDSEAFAVITNHFKSKSTTGASGDNLDTGQGGFNGDRTRQATALADFADAFLADRGIDKVFLTGDFNSYSQEDPMQVLYARGYTKLESDQPGETSYSFNGLSGSLDHVLANDEALDTVTGVDIWDINAPESVGYQYSRFNYNVTDLFEGNNAFASSDHNPEIVGIDTGMRQIQVLGINDFHGRIANNPLGDEAGAAVLAGAVDQMRAQNPDTVFAAAGDLIGASTFESFIQQDKPTIDALNAAGLDVSAVGNHEFDKGYDDLVNRVMAPYDPVTNEFGGAEWEYIGANVKFKDDGSDALEPTWVQTFDDVEVGFIGAVTEHLPELVSPAGIEDIEATDIVAATNEEAAALKDEGVDIIVLLVHEGAATTALSSATDPASDFGKIVNGVNKHVDAIISGHTHLAYNHAIPVQTWANEGRQVTKRPVVSAGQYGMALNRLRFQLNADEELVRVRQNLVDLKGGTDGPNFPANQEVADIVSAAVAEANVLGAEPLGEVAGPFNRAKLANGTTENRGGESTLGNLVAEVQRWATESPTTGSAQIAFMNPGGLRQDMVGLGTGAYPRTLTYKQAAEVQPFANTLVNMDRTGAQIKQALEQQWQPAGAARPFLRLGASEGFTYTYDPSKAAGSRITGMWLDGTPIDPAATYSVTVNSFLASGGDNFGAFAADPTRKQDTGQTDLEAMVNYMDEFASAAPLAVDYTQRAVGVTFPAAAPATYAAGETVAFSLSSLAMSTTPDTKDSSVTVSLDGAGLGAFPVDNVIGTDILDEYGKASVSVTLPAGTTAGAHNLLVEGVDTGTQVIVPITVTGGTPGPGPGPGPGAVATTTSASAPSVEYGEASVVTAKVAPAGAAGTVRVLLKGTVVGTGTLSGGTATISIAGKLLSPGAYPLTVSYDGNTTHQGSSTTISHVVTKATPTMTVKAPSKVEVGDRAKVKVKLSVANDVPLKGRVELTVKGGQTIKGKVEDGKVVFLLAKARAKDVGTKLKVVIVYGGTNLVAKARDTVRIKVVDN